MTGKMWVLLDCNLNLSSKITPVHERERQSVYLLLDAFFFFLLAASVK